MNRKRKALLGLPLVVILGLIGYSLVLGIPPGFDAPSLAFPIDEADRVERLSAYHTPDWGEPGVFHNGIDLVISDNVTILSPTSGVISRVSERINPYAGNVLFEIGIAANWGWEVKLVLEPGFQDSVNNSLQSDMIDVVFGQRVQAGDELATLLHSEQYPHLHYMLLYMGQDVCAYNFSSASAQSTFETIATDSGTNIFFPHSAPSTLLGPTIVVPAAIIAVYWVIMLALFRIKKE